MDDGLKTANQADGANLTAEVDRQVAEVSSSRAKAVDRVTKGGAVAGLGFGLGFLVDVLDPTSGLFFWGGMSIAATTIGAGCLWAGLGATHLIRFGKKGSSFVLGSLAGLGGTLLLQMLFFALQTIWEHPIVTLLSLGARAGSGLFMAVLLIASLIAVVRWILRDSEEGKQPEPDPSPRSS